MLSDRPLKSQHLARLLAASTTAGLLRGPGSHTSTVDSGGPPPMGAACTSAPLTAWQCLVCADASQGVCCVSGSAESAAAGHEAGPVAAESTCRWKTGGPGLPEQAIRRVLLGACEASPRQGLPAFPCVPGSGGGRAVGR